MECRAQPFLGGVGQVLPHCHLALHWQSRSWAHDNLSFRAHLKSPGKLLQWLHYKHIQIFKCETKRQKISSYWQLQNHSLQNRVGSDFHHEITYSHSKNQDIVEEYSAVDSVNRTMEMKPISISFICRMWETYIQKSSSRSRKNYSHNHCEKIHLSSHLELMTNIISSNITC